ncbi:MAG: c-type cytochrome biogenesis protein CcsB [Chloroflexi bacterium]|nr:c-type cytochrome biogenesis protein CcsB [Chloroflexota bacterium]
MYTITMPLTLVGLGLATIAYLGYLLTSKDILGKLGWGFSLIGLVALTALEVDFIVTFKRLPLTSLYEMSLSLAWGIVLAYVITHLFVKTYAVGLFVVPIGFIIALYNASQGRDDVTRYVVPALQSYWLQMHVIVAIIAYSAFTVSAGLGIMYFLTRESYLATSRKHATALAHRLGLPLLLKVVSPEIDKSGAMTLSRTLYEPETEPSERPARRVRQPAGRPSPTADELEALSDEDIAVAANEQVATAYDDIIGATKKRHPKARIFGLSMQRPSRLGFDALIGATKEQRNSGKLAGAAMPRRTTLIRWNYRAVAIGFVFQTMLLITGAIWAQYAWGTWWGWDPKEIWALITWFIYAFFLHARAVRGWAGNRLALLAIISFGTVMFTWLGVNWLVNLIKIESLHAY